MAVTWIWSSMLDHICVPVSISTTVHPSDQMSDLCDTTSSDFSCSESSELEDPYHWIITSSGAIQNGVPVNVCVLFYFKLSMCLDIPKSAIFRTPSLVIKMLCDLISLWTNLFWCNYLRPYNICLVYSRIKSSLKTLFIFVSSFKFVSVNEFIWLKREPPSISSKTTNKLFLYSIDLIVSIYFTIFGCDKSFKIDISISICCSIRVSPSKLICFTA